MRSRSDLGDNMAFPLAAWQSGENLRIAKSFPHFSFVCVMSITASQDLLAWLQTLSCLLQVGLESSLDHITARNRKSQTSPESLSHGVSG